MTSSSSPSTPRKRRKPGSLSTIGLPSSKQQLSPTKREQPNRSVKQLSIKERVKIRRKELDAIRSKISIFTHPIVVIKYFLLAVFDYLREFFVALTGHWIVVTLLGLLIAASPYYYYHVLTSSQQQWVQDVESLAMWYGYWIALGIASSIGLGTGLHTFVLFLGPHIAHVTITAYSCNSLDFPVRGDERQVMGNRFTSSFTCPDSETVTHVAFTFWQLFHKVALESFFWGMGTAIGELPPYFVARAAAAAGQDDQEFSSFEQILNKDEKDRTFAEKVQAYMYELMQKTGFFGILLCASIPNPLFDLAGIICGHFSIPFYTFFGATFIGKALIKSSIQSLAVVVLFSEEILDFLLKELKALLPSLHRLVRNTLNEQAKTLRRRPGEPHLVKTEKSTAFGFIWNGVILLMIGYFVLSIIVSLSVNRIKKQHEKELIHYEKELRKEK